MTIFYKKIFITINFLQKDGYMKIFNIRRGFATNSSSTHSIIFHNNELQDNIIYENGFGWEEFICRSKKAKISYFKQSLLSSLPYEMEDDEKIKITRKVFHDCSHAEKGIIDHQSLFRCPKYLNGEYATDFYKVFTDSIIYNDELAIVGGNDNNEDDSFMDFKEFDTYFHAETKYLARKEDYGWVLFTPNNGLKLRVGENAELVENFTTYIPELVDLKITDYCPKNCVFCYQGSTNKGRHARLYNIFEIIELLSEMGVFEVAIGGGEPIFHPQFIKILKECNKHNIKPNFTTANYEWLEYQSFYDYITNLVGGIGVSITSINDLQRLKNIFKKRSYYSISFHYIMGIKFLSEFENILEYINNNFPNSTILLLGYKNMGRATNVKEIKYNQDWVKLSKKYKKISISIDTKLANDYEHFLDANEVDRRTYCKSEGIYSKYIDAVNLIIGKSSYCEKYHKFSSEKIGNWIRNEDIKKLKQLLIKRENE